MLVAISAEDDLESARREAIRILCGLLVQPSQGADALASFDISDDAGTIHRVIPRLFLCEPGDNDSAFW